MKCTIQLLDPWLPCCLCWSDFLRKVYTLLSLQIILTTATSALFMFSQTIKEFVHARWGWPFREPWIFPLSVWIHNMWYNNIQHLHICIPPHQKTFSREKNRRNLMENDRGEWPESNRCYNTFNAEMIKILTVVGRIMMGWITTNDNSGSGCSGLTIITNVRLGSPIPMWLLGWMYNGCHYHYTPSVCISV